MTLVAGPAAALGGAQNGTSTPATTPTDSPGLATTPNTSTPSPTATPVDTPSASPTPTLTTTATPREEPAGGTVESADNQFNLRELRRGGRKASAQAPPSVRLLGSRGAVAIRYTPAAPFSGGSEYLEPGTTLNTDDVTLYSTRFGDDIEPRDLTLHVVYYTPGVREVASGNGSTVARDVPVNVTHQRVDVTLGTGYSSANVSLRSHFGEPVDMTMWLSTPGGQAIDGARWAGLQHRSDPAAQSTNIQDKGDLWEYVLFNAFGVGALALLGAFGLGNHVLKRIGRGPNLGLAAYAVVGIIATVAIGTAGYLAANTVLANIPIVWGALLGLIGFVGYLEVGGPPGRRFLFEQDELTDATSPSGDDVQDSVKQFIDSVNGIRREDGTIGLPANGIRPAIARYFAEPATLEEIDLTTRVNVDGDFDEKFIADPDAGDVLVHTPARLVFDPTLIEDRNPNLRDQQRGVFERINWTFIVGSLGAVVGGWFVGQQVFQMPVLGLVPGVLVALALAHEARDGTARFEPAPVHMRSAKATVLGLGREYDDAKTYEEAERERFRAEATTATDLRRREKERAKVTSQRIAEESVGVNFDAGARNQPNSAAPLPENEQARRQASRKQGPGVNGSASGEEDEEDDDKEGWNGA